MYKKFTPYITFTRSYLSDVKDGSGTLVFDHALRVFRLLDEVIEHNQKDKRDMLIAALFHDLLEDTKCTEKDIVKIANKKVLSYVKELTISFEGKELHETVQPLTKISEASRIIKLADISDNTTKTIYVVRNNGIRWYREFYEPLLEEYIKIINVWKNDSKDFKNEFNILSHMIFSDMKILDETVHLLYTEE